MPLLKQYNQEQLATWRSSRVCCLYMNAFSIKEAHPESHDLEDLARNLFNIDFKKRLEIREILKEELEKRVKTEDYGSAARFRDMLRYYEEHVMG